MLYFSGLGAWGLQRAYQNYQRLIYQIAHHMHEMDRGMGGQRLMDKMQHYMNEQQHAVDISQGNEQPSEAYQRQFDAERARIGIEAQGGF